MRSNSLEYEHVYKTIKRSCLFNVVFYKKQLKNLGLSSKQDCIKHYIEEGVELGLDPSPSFSTLYYLSQNKDVRKEGLNPFLHYILFGYSELRRPKESICQEDFIPFKSIFCFDILLKRLYGHYKRENYSVSYLFKMVKRDGLSQSIVNIKNIVVNRKIYISNSLNGQSYTYITPIYTKVIKQEIASLRKKPKISIIMPVYNVDVKWLKKAINSVKKQWYPNWELCIVDDNSKNTQLVRYLENLNHNKIKIQLKNVNEHISATSNAALKMSTGEFVALVDHDDEITPDALYEVVKVINKSNADFIYSDEDKIDLKGNYSEPHYKPCFSPDMLNCQNYISHLTVIRKELLNRVDGFTVGREGAQDYDLYLKVLELNPKIKNINKILYHWSKIPGSTAVSHDSKSYAHINGKKSLLDSLMRCNVKAEVYDGKFPGTYDVKYRINNEPLVSIIIPFKDKPEILSQCLTSIFKSTYKNYEIICIDNNSKGSNVKKLKEKYESKYVSFYEYNSNFNYSAINNYAVKYYAKGSHLIFLNNDTEVISEDWIESLLQYSQQDDVGAVGALLLYPNDRIQHAGVILSLGGVANHSHLGLHKEHSGYFGRPWITQNISAVTAACMMCKTSIFKKVCGFDSENLPISFNDIDLCLKFSSIGYKNIYNPNAKVIHYESLSRSKKYSDQLLKETQYMIRKYKNRIQNDPYYSKELLEILKNKEYSPYLNISI